MDEEMKIKRFSRVKNFYSVLKVFDKNTLF